MSTYLAECFISPQHKVVQYDLTPPLTDPLSPMSCLVSSRSRPLTQQTQGYTDQGLLVLHVRDAFPTQTTQYAGPDSSSLFRVSAERLAFRYSQIFTRNHGGSLEITMTLMYPDSDIAGHVG